MRIIAGKNRGRVLKEFKGNAVRPTSDMAREAIFNILQNRIAGASFLDLYSGTGGIALEALSRGAARAVAVDVSAESVKLAEENAAILKEQLTVIKSDALSFVKNCREKFDVIFADPPYADDCDEALRIIAERGILCDGGIIVRERPKDKGGKDIEGLIKTDERRYGIAYFDFYKAD